MKRSIVQMFLAVLEVLLVLVSVATPAEPPGPEIVIDGKSIKGHARIEITTLREEPEPPGAPSPTGREPRILWSREWQARWERARAENHPWYQWLAGGAQSSYFDKDLSPALMYQITGDAAYARKAWQACAKKVDPAHKLSGNNVRGSLFRLILLHEWLYPALTELERGQLAAAIDKRCDYVRNVRLGDSDQVIAFYFGVATWAALSDSPVAKEVRDSELFGGLVPRELAPDQKDARNQLARFAELSQGGEWFEGTYYSNGTTQKLMLGLAAMRDLARSDPIHGVEEDRINPVTTNLFPELWALVPQFAQAAVHRMDNTLSHRLTWGAIEIENYGRAGIRRGDLITENWCTAAGLSGDGLLANQIHRTWEKGSWSRYWQRPHAECYLFFDPFEQAGGRRPEARGSARGDAASPPIPPSPSPPFLVCEGQQLLYARSSWTDQDATVVLFRCGRHNQADHPTFDAGHFELLRRGEWVLTGPRRYDDLGNADGLGANNSLLLGNQPVNFERREMLGAGVEQAGDLRPEAGGDARPQASSLQPPAYYMVQEHGGPWQHGQKTLEYVHSAKRWLVLLPGESDVLLVRDVLDIDQPVDQRFAADGSGRETRKTYNIGNAYNRHAAYVASQAADEGGSGGAGEGGRIPLVQWILHAPVKPQAVDLRPEANRLEAGDLRPEDGTKRDALGQERLRPPASSLQSPAYSWTTPRGQRVLVTTLLPAPDSIVVELIDEANHYGKNVAAKELGWQIRVAPAGFSGGQVELLHAVTISDAGNANRPEIRLEGSAVRVGSKLVEFTQSGVKVSQ